MKGRIAGVVIAVVGTAIVVATFLASEGSLLERHPLTFAALFFIWVGGLIVYRIGHRIGWVTAAVGLMFAANGFLDEIPVGSLTDQLQLTAWTSALFFAGLLIFWFPTGHAVSPRWTWVSWIAGSAQALALIWTFVDGPEAEVSPGQEVAAVGFLLVAWFIVIAVISLVVRYLRASGIVRQQIKWFAFAVITVQLLNLGWETISTWLPVSQTFWDVALALALMAVPISIGVAILRFRLYEIDRLVSRTVTYLVVLGMLSLVFIALVWLPWVLVVGTGDSSPPGAHRRIDVGGGCAVQPDPKTGAKACRSSVQPIALRRRSRHPEVRGRSPRPARRRRDRGWLGCRGVHHPFTGIGRSLDPYLRR